MQGCLCDQGIIIFRTESSRATRERARNDADRLKLGARIRDCFFVYREGLRKAFVCNILVLTLARDLGTRYEEPQDKIRHTSCGDTCVQ